VGIGVTVGVGYIEGCAVAVLVALMLPFDDGFEMGAGTLSNPSPSVAAITITMMIISAITAATHVRASMQIPPCWLCFTSVTASELAAPLL